MRNAINLMFVILLFTGLASAQNIPSFPVGEQWQFPDARTLGMAGAGSISNSRVGALLMNPAAMGRNRSGLQLQISPSARSQEERRSFPIYDRFGSFLTNGIYVVNDNWFTSLQGGLQYNFESMAILKSVAAGFFTENDQNYFYEEEVRANDFNGEQVPLAYNTVHYDGKLIRFSLGAAVQPAEKFNLGFQIGLLSGDLDSKRSVAFLTANENDEFTGSSRSLSNTPIVASAGVIYQLNPYFNFGGHLRLPYQIDYEVQNSVADVNTISFTESIEYPMQLNVGLEYRGQQALQARLNIDVVYEWWSKVDYETEELTLRDSFDDVLKIKTGIEHIFFNQIPFQVGLQYRTFFQNRSDPRLMFTAGTGFMGNNWQVNVAGGFSRVDYRGSDLFDDSIFGGDRSASLIDDVEESNFFGMATFIVNIGN